MTGSIGDLLSVKQKEALLTSLVSEGDVFRMHLGEDEGVKGKHPNEKGRNKYFVVIGTDSQGNAFGFVLINSVINQALPQKRKDKHYPLFAKDYPFLEGKNRFVDCSDFKVISKSKFAQLFGSQTTKSRLKEKDITFIKQEIISYEDVSPKLLKRFGLIEETAEL